MNTRQLRNVSNVLFQSFRSNPINFCKLFRNIRPSSLQHCRIHIKNSYKLSNSSSLRQQRHIVNNTRLTQNNINVIQERSQLFRRHVRNKLKKVLAQKSCRTFLRSSIQVLQVSCDYCGRRLVHGLISSCLGGCRKAQRVNRFTCLSSSVIFILQRLQHTIDNCLAQRAFFRQLIVLRQSFAHSRRNTGVYVTWNVPRINTRQQITQPHISHFGRSQICAKLFTIAPRSQDISRRSGLTRLYRRLSQSFKQPSQTTPQISSTALTGKVNSFLINSFPNRFQNFVSSFSPRLSRPYRSFRNLVSQLSRWNIVNTAKSALSGFRNRHCRETVTNSNACSGPLQIVHVLAKACAVSLQTFQSSVFGRFRNTCSFSRVISKFQSRSCRLRAGNVTNTWCALSRNNCVRSGPTGRASGLSG